MKNKITFSDLPSRATDRFYAYSKNAYLRLSETGDLGL